MTPSVRLIGLTQPVEDEDYHETLGLETPLDIIEFSGRWDYGEGSVAKMRSDPEHGKVVTRWLKSGEESMIEMVNAVFFITCSRVVSHELVRHRVACVSGATEISLGRYSSTNRSLGLRSGGSWTRPISTIWRNWHEGVPDIRGRKPRLLASCQNLPARVLNEESGLFEAGLMKNVWRAGTKELLSVAVDSGQAVKASRDHLFLTPDGWTRADDLRQGDSIARVGKKNIYGGTVPRVPPALRQGISVWARTVKPKVITRPTDHCYVCNDERSYDDLELDHVIPVMDNLPRALDVSNLAPICASCHRHKSNAEVTNVETREIVAGSLFSHLVRKPRVVSEEETYDIEMTGDHHNYIANGLVVHNSYQQESQRFVNYENESAAALFMIPDGLTREQERIIRAAYSRDLVAYQELRDAGMSKQNARYVLPNGTRTRIVAGMNLRQWRHVLRLRMHPSAQPETQEIANLIFKKLVRRFPVVFEDLPDLIAANRAPR